MNFTMKQLSIAFVIVSLSFLWSLSMLQKNRDKNVELEKEKVRLEKQIDSLEGEIYAYELRIFKLERAVEIFEEENPQASSQLSDIISDETE